MATSYATANYYAEERRTFKEAYATHVTDDEALLILRKLYRHYKIPKRAWDKIRIKFWGHHDSGSARGYRIRLSHNPTIGLIIHEFVHCGRDWNVFRDFEYKVKDKGSHHHGLRFQVCLSRVHYFAKGKGYWKETLQRRREKRAK